MTTLWYRKQQVLYILDHITQLNPDLYRKAGDISVLSHMSPAGYITPQMSYYTRTFSVHLSRVHKLNFQLIAHCLSSTYPTCFGLRMWPSSRSYEFHRRIHNNQLQYSFYASVKLVAAYRWLLSVAETC